MLDSGTASIEIAARIEIHALGKSADWIHRDRVLVERTQARRADAAATAISYSRSWT